MEDKPSSRAAQETFEFLLAFPFYLYIGAALASSQSMGWVAVLAVAVVSLGVYNTVLTATRDEGNAQRLLDLVKGEPGARFAYRSTVELGDIQATASLYDLVGTRAPSDLFLARVSTLREPVIVLKDGYEFENSVTRTFLVAHELGHASERQRRHEQMMWTGWVQVFGLSALVALFQQLMVGVVMAAFVGLWQTIRLLQGGYEIRREVDADRFAINSFPEIQRQPVAALMLRHFKNLGYPFTAGERWIDNNNHRLPGDRLCFFFRALALAYKYGSANGSGRTPPYYRLAPVCLATDLPFAIALTIAGCYAPAIPFNIGTVVVAGMIYLTLPISTGLVQSVRWHALRAELSAAGICRWRTRTVLGRFLGRKV